MHQNWSNCYPICHSLDIVTGFLFPLRSENILIIKMSIWNRFFVVSNAIACSYAAASLVITVMARNSGRRKSDVTDLVVTALDLVLMALLFSANGAACAVGVIAQKGNTHAQWMKVCDVFDAYCRHVTAALVLSIIGSTVFLLLVLHSVLKLHYRSRS